MLTTPLWVANTRLKLQGVKFRKEKQEDKQDGVEFEDEIRVARYSGMLGQCLNVPLIKCV